MEEIRDKKGTSIKVGSVIKVFHFVGARRKKHYMYKVIMLHPKYGLHAYDIVEIATKGIEAAHSCTANALRRCDFEIVAE